MDWMNWQFLASVALIFAVSEIFISGFVMLPVGLGFLVPALLSVFTQNYWIVGLGFCAAEVGIFLILKSRRRNNQNSNPEMLSNADAMVGSEAVVTERIPAGGLGYVKRFGDHWMARAIEPHDIEAGVSVTILGVDGNKVIVKKKLN